MREAPGRDPYVFDPSQREHERLVSRAQRYAEEARVACSHAGLRPGDKAIDVGCGPLGALGVLADLVGPTGAVVGLDTSEEALELARRVLTDRGSQSSPSFRQM